MLIFTLIFAAASHAAGTLVIVVGAEGEPAFGRQFAEWADRWAAAAPPDMRVERVGGGTAATQPATAPSSTGPAATQPMTDKARLQSVLAAEVRQTEQPLWLVLIGHGTAVGPEAQFNLNGPDVSATELAGWLAPVKRPVAVINCASASGPFVNRLSGPNRVIVTATRSGSEYQFARFGGPLSSAIVDKDADLDKDGQTSLLEAFLIASRQTEAFYKQSGRLATEHALLDDNGDRLGVSADWFDGVRPARAARQGTAVDGAAANQWILRPTLNTRPLTAEQATERQRLEAAVEALRRRKATLTERDYYAELEPLMLKLAELYR